MGVSASKLAITVNFWLDALLFANFDVFLDFNNVNVKIWKIKDHQITLIDLSIGLVDLGPP